MRLSLHRSITFWSGLLVIIFIAWASWDSTRRWSIGTYGGWQVMNIECGVTITWTPEGPYATSAYRLTPEEGSLRITRPRYLRKAAGETPEAAAERFRQQYSHREDDSRGVIKDTFLSTIVDEPGSWTLYLPHWCLIAGMLPLWLGLLVWRARRRRKAAAAA